MRQVCRVLKHVPEGDDSSCIHLPVLMVCTVVSYINGVHVEAPNPDHARHGNRCGSDRRGLFQKWPYAKHICFPLGKK